MLDGRLEARDRLPEASSWVAASSNNIARHKLSETRRIKLDRG